MLVSSRGRLQIRSLNPTPDLLNRNTWKRAQDSVLLTSTSGHTVIWVYSLDHTLRNTALGDRQDFNRVLTGKDYPDTRKKLN